MMDDLALLADLHAGRERQGPGSRDTTLRALEATGLDPAAPLTVADLGCGTGASLGVLADALPNARFAALDFLLPFLEPLAEAASARGVRARVLPVVGDLAAPPLAERGFDLLWSEGAIYNIGFGTGLDRWRRLLRPGGVLVVSEISWLTDERPAAIEGFWTEAYPEIATVAEKFARIEAAGYETIDHFVLPPSDWLDRYYTPLEADLDAFVDRHGRTEAARAVAAAQREEIALYRTYGEHFGYGMFIARRPG
jgi:SAM-dependent methyltransferase